ncbi:anaerobic ribonucleoside-triphosphate reductase activating protein [Uliginosibacterium sediminicola]|uniref:Anaerobic ribonucleoside-triphosphate reductase activating protein n=1 Tax=Uliginosibacterium sediminicola TaxID=2024550 RepID=A0ABU9Z3U5_9RHOO
MPSAVFSTSRAERPAADLRIGGFVPCSTQDWPDQLAAVVFLAGCAWRCHYCHNPHLQSRQALSDLHWDDLLPLLATRRALLDGVVFSGGEPTIDAALPAAIDAVRALGLKVALHSAGSHPHKLAALLDKLDWIGLDIKTLPAEYDALTGCPGSGAKAWASLKLVLESGCDHELRITAHPNWLPEARLDALIAELAALGAQQVAIQAARAPGATRSNAHYSADALARWAEQLPQLTLRGFS